MYPSTAFTEQLLRGVERGLRGAPLTREDPNQARGQARQSDGVRIVRASRETLGGADEPFDSVAAPHFDGRPSRCFDGERSTDPNRFAAVERQQ